MNTRVTFVGRAFVFWAIVCGGDPFGVCPKVAEGAAIWRSLSDMSESRQYHTATTLANGQILVTGGTGVGGVLTSCELYDPMTDIWSVTGNLNEARSEHEAVLLRDGRVLAVGGRVPDNGGILDLATAESL